MGFNFFEKNRIVTAGAVSFCLVMIIWPEVTALASREAIELWLNSIVPSLLPFFIVSGFLRQTGFGEKVSPKAYPFVMAFLSGYPMGAKVAGDYYRDRRIGDAQLKWILSYSCVTGPAFLIGAAGIEFLGSHRAGMVLALSHYGAAFFNYIFYRPGGMFCEGETVERTGERKKTGRDNYYNLLTDAILDSFKSIAIILAYIILFMIATDLLQFSGLLHVVPGGAGPSFVKGLFEMTVGCSGVAVSPVGEPVKAALCAFLISFGGLSVTGQSMSMLRNCGVSAWAFLRMKLIHGCISGLLAFSLGCFML